MFTHNTYLHLMKKYKYIIILIPKVLHYKSEIIEILIFTCE